MFEPHEIDFLKANELPRQRWLGDSNARPILDELTERGLMQPASGEFGPPRDKGEKLHLFGRKVPVVEMTSLWMLTEAGKAAYEEATR